MHFFDGFDSKKSALLGMALGAAAALFVIGSFVPKAKAWSGCGVGVGASHTIGEINAGGPIGLASTGQMAHASLNCDWRMQQIVMGLDANYGFMFGDLESLGVKRDLTLSGRAGVLATSNALVYGHVGWSHLWITNLANTPDINGIKVGFGTEIKLADAPLYIDTRYSFGMYDVDKIFGPGIDARTHAVMVSLKFKFGPKYQPPVIFDDVPAPCDPKLASCKKK